MWKASNVAIEHRWAEDRNERFPRLAAELVQRGVACSRPSAALLSLPRRQRRLPLRSSSMWGRPSFVRIRSSLSRPEAT